MSTYDFDGVDIDWSYPVARDRGGRPDYLENLPRFVHRLKQMLTSTDGRDGLSMTLPASQRQLQHFDIKKPDKVVLGLAFYGRGFTAASTTCMNPGCPFESGSLFGNCSQEIGLLYNSKIDALLFEKNIEPQLYNDAAVKVATWDDQWVAYDDVETFGIKVDFAKGQCMGGLMVSAVGYDNANATYSLALDKIVDRQLKWIHRVDPEGT